MSHSFSSFNALNRQNKIAALSQIKQGESRTESDFHLALHALLDEDQQVKLTAKLAYQTFAKEPYFVDLRGLSFDQITEKITLLLRKTYGYMPIRVDFKPSASIQELSKDLQARIKKAELHSEWDGPFPKPANLLNTLRDDTRQLILSFLDQDERIDRAFLGFYQESWKPFRDCIRSIDSTTMVNIVNLGFVREDLLTSTVFQALFALVDAPAYLLVLLTSERVILFLRDEIKESAGALQSIPYRQIRMAEAKGTTRGFTLTIETRQEIFTIPRMFPADAQEIEAYLKEKAISTIQAQEDFIERDFDRELSRLELLYQTKAVTNSEYVFRKSRLKKMELEKFSDTNIEAMLAKRFADVGFGEKIDQELLKRFSSEKTIMFTDIVGYSKKAAEKRLLDTVTLLAVHDRTLLPIIRNHQGFLVKKIGDALMLRFDQPEDACHSALEIQRALIDFNRSSTEKILVRIGINTGTVFIRNEDTFGDAVNLASRMESLAQPGRIFLTEATVQRLGGAFPTQDYGLRTIKGYSHQIRVFALTDTTGEGQEMLNWATELEPERPEGPAPPTPAPAAVPVPHPIPAAASAADHLHAARADVLQAVERYKAAVRLGAPRDPQIEDWFNFFANHLKDRFGS